LVPGVCQVSAMSAYSRADWRRERNECTRTSDAVQVSKCMDLDQLIHTLPPTHLTVRGDGVEGDTWW
jgi:hypothetical protein